MNKKLGLAVAGALAAFATSANAGITIPAGDWTVDVGGNINAFYTHTTTTGATSKNTIQTGLLPTALAIGAKTRQNDLDVAFQFSFWTGVNAAGPLNYGNGNGGLGYSSLNIRQAYMTFGDASWGTVKMGRDLGTFGSDAILSDMTLLGVGSFAGGGGSSTLGRIGSGYLYADWIAQIQYQTPNFNGFQGQAALREALGDSTGNEMGFDGKLSYSFAANDVTGKVWVGGIHQKINSNARASVTQANSLVTGTAAGTATVGYYVSTASVSALPVVQRTSEAFEIGGKVAYEGAELVGYYYNGKNFDSGIGTAIASAVISGNDALDHDNVGGYVQATFKVPTLGTKIGASWGTSIIEKAGTETADAEREAWIVGAYHPLTKSVNLVAEYNNLDITSSANVKSTAKTVSLGAIMFF